MSRPLRHGTRYHWRKGCRCLECTAAARAHAQAQNERRRYGREAHPAPGRPGTNVDGACVCSCGQQCPSRKALGAHCWAAHNRWPSDAERIILAAKAAA